MLAHLMSSDIKTNCVIMEHISGCPHQNWKLICNQSESLFLPLPREEALWHLFVCLFSMFGSKITRQLLNGFAWHFQGSWQRVKKQLLKHQLNSGSDQKWFWLEINILHSVTSWCYSMNVYHTTVYTIWIQEFKGFFIIAWWSSVPSVFF